MESEVTEDCITFGTNKPHTMNNDIFPCLWFDEDGKEAADFYTETFGGSITVDTPMVYNIELFGQKIMLLDAGPQFQKNASISLMVICKTEEEVQNYWNRFLDGGLVLMELNEYPWSKKYGWIRDKFGLTWQFYFGETPENAQRLIPTLMFMHQNNGKAKEAIHFYTGIFPDSNIGKILEYKNGGEDNGEPGENVQHADFELSGYTFFCMDSSIDHKFDFSEGISIVKMTDSQEETDHLWNSLISDGGQESMCGWLKDKYGISWQIIPKKLLELGIFNENKEQGQKVFQAMLKMKKIIISDLENAANSN